MSRTFNKRTVICRLGDQLTTVHHSHVSVRSARWISLQPFNLLYDFEARDDETKDNMDSAQNQNNFYAYRNFYVEIITLKLVLVLFSNLCLYFLVTPFIMLIWQFYLIKRTRQDEAQSWLFCWCKIQHGEDGKEPRRNHERGKKLRKWTKIKQFTTCGKISKMHRSCLRPSYDFRYLTLNIFENLFEFKQ